MSVKVGGATMNNWGKFAEMLGLELEQEFVITDVDGNRKNKYTYKITEDGLLYKSPIFNWAISSLGTIANLLDGDIKAVPKPWKPKKGDIYSYYINSTYFDGINSRRWTDEDLDLLLWKSGNCFKTEEEAETKGKETMEQIKKEYEEN